MAFQLRNMLLGFLLFGLAACTLPADMDAPQVDMGDFDLGFNIVVVNEPQVGPYSRKATDEEWKTALTEAIDERFGGYDGDKLYHIGVKMDAYVLARPGIPVVFRPQSILVLTVNIWDDAAQAKLNEEEKVLTIYEGVSADSIIGSGLTRNKKQQMQLLVNNAAKAIQDWILENPEWVGLPPLPKDDASEAANAN